MNGLQIERVLDLIDGNLEITRGELLSYLSSHEDEIVAELLDKGSANIPTSAGVIRIPRADLAEFACSR